MTTYGEKQIQARHQERVSALVDLFGSTHQIPTDIINKLQERNKEDWVQFIAERDGKAKSTPDAPLIPPATDEQIAAVDTPVNPDNSTDEPDAQTIDAEDAEQLLNEEA
jgi:hypothetical protein